jgi:thioredoxin reductase
VYRGRSVVMATGMTPREPDKDGMGHEPSRADYNYTYGDAPWDCTNYRGRHVFVVGNGNSGMELSSHLIQNCAAMRVWT